MLIGPAAARRSRRVRAQLAKLEGEVVTRRRPIADKLPAVQREVRALEVALRETTAVIPEEKDPQDVLRNLHELASESSLDIATLQAEDGRRQDAVHGVADPARPRGQLPRPRPVLRSARGDVAADLGVRSRRSRPSASRTARGTVAVTCLATTFVFKKDCVGTPDGSDDDALEAGT